MERRRTLHTIPRPVFLDISDPKIAQNGTVINPTSSSSSSSSSSDTESIPFLLLQTDQDDSFSIAFEASGGHISQPSLSSRLTEYDLILRPDNRNQLQIPMRPRRENAQIHIFAATLLETLCAMYEPNEQRRTAVVQVIVETLQKHGFVDWPLAFSDEFQSHRRQYLTIFSQVIQDAVGAVRRDDRGSVIPRHTALLSQLALTSSVALHNRQSQLQLRDSGPSRYRAEFNELSVIGKGGFGKVYKVRNKLDGSVYAMKIIPIRMSATLDADKCQQVLREVKVLASLSHSNIVRYNSAWLEPTEDHQTSNHTEVVPFVASPRLLRRSFSISEKVLLYIQMELCHSSLYQWISQRNKHLVRLHTKPMDQYRAIGKNDCLIFSKQLIKALIYIHSKNIIHRDIKTRNIFISGCNELKLGDFGLAREVELLVSSPVTCSPSTSSADSLKQMSGGLGTSLYASPEQQAGRKYGVKADIYSAAICLFELFNVFDTGMERHSMIDSFRSQTKLTASMEAVFPEQAMVLTTMINNEAEMRPSALELLDTELCLGFQQMTSYLKARITQLESTNKQLIEENTVLKQQCTISTAEYEQFIQWKKEYDKPKN